MPDHTYLFSPKDVNTLVEESTRLDSSVAISDRPRVHLSYYGKAARFTQELERLFTQQKAHQVDFMTAGNFSLHNIIEFLIDTYGACREMCVSTWAIKEAAARSLLDLKERGLIGELYGVFDYRIKTIDARSFHLIEKLFTKYELTKNHAKVVTLRGADYHFTVITSANMSNNPRIEAGFISRSKHTYYFHHKWMRDVINGIKAH